MDKVLEVAKYITTEYRKMTGDFIDEMKLQKLLYFAQREMLAITNAPMFNENFEGWVHGPVCVEVRAAFENGDIPMAKNIISDEAAYVLNNVLLTYAEYDTWKLRNLSHKEISWINARKGLAFDEPGDRVLKLDDIREDAKKVRPYDHVYDMYYDEFTDEELVNC